MFGGPVGVVDPTRSFRLANRLVETKPQNEEKQ
jgi:hypothetical protein